MDYLEYFVNERGSVYVIEQGHGQLEVRTGNTASLESSDILSFRKSSRLRTALDLNSDSGVSARIKAIT